MATLEGADKGFAQNVNRLMQDTGATLTSGYRSNQEQQKLYDAALAKYGSEKEARKWAAKPGGSNHEHGFAADIANYDKISDEQLKQYGLYRPMAWEPWHVEPIGHRGEAGSYTTPSTDVPGMAAVEQVSSVMDQLMASVNVGDQGSVVGAQATTVGATAMDQAQAASMPTEATAAPAATGAVSGTTGGSELDGLMAAIGTKESGNNYEAVNKDSGAHGKYQIMPANWPSWSKEAGLPANAPKTPENQERVARYKLGQYLDKYGVEGAAQAWYGGEGSVGKSSRGGGYGGQYPTVGQYGSDIASKVK